MSTALLDVTADVGSEDDEEYDEETGEIRSKENGTNGHIDDSSEEEDDDDDEEAAAAIREGFIVDEDEEEEEDRVRKRRDKKKRRRAEREEDEVVLDEEDLDLIGENIPDLKRKESSQSKFKRLKRGHKNERAQLEPRGIDEIFSDEDEDLENEHDDRRPRYREGRAIVDEFADFIEEDEFEDEARDQLIEDREVARPSKKSLVGVVGVDSAGLDETTLEDMRAAFGDGTEYDWALQMEEELDEEQQGIDRPLELKDVFEPSQLVDRMMTDEDNEIRTRDIPERFQVARKAFKEADLSEEDAGKRAKHEALWVAHMLLPKKRLERHLVEPFQTAVERVLEFMNYEDFEIPFIFQHRKDYLIHAGTVDFPADADDPDATEPQFKAERLLSQSDMWEIFELDIKYRAMAEKRDILWQTYENLKKNGSISDSMLEELLPSAVTLEELQDIQDYMHFQYSAELKDVNLLEADTNGTQKRARATRNLFEKLRMGKVYHMVRGFGISADQFAQNALEGGRRRFFTDDMGERPDDMADSLLDPPEYTTGTQILRAAKAMFTEELVLSPRMRKLMRQQYYQDGLFDCFRTEKGLRKIGEDHQYYELKYLRKQSFAAFAQRPDLFLRMLKAEQEGLIEVKMRLKHYKDFEKGLYKYLESDNYSEVAESWNSLRREVLQVALQRLDKIMTRGVKETLKAECENQVARICRERYSEKLDQAPYKPKGEATGTVPRVLAFSNGNGVPGRDAICWIWAEDDGKMIENGKFVDIRLGNAERYIPDGKDVQPLADLISRLNPDVIAVSGFSVETRKLYKDIQEIVEIKQLRGSTYEDDNGIERTDLLDVVIVNDEVARLYHTSNRAAQDYPSLPPLARYCVALARYLQDPLKEYASLGKSIDTISFDLSQNLVPKEKIMKHLETAMVDMVNLVGVDINEALHDAYTSNLLPYICGLGARKAAQLLRVVNTNGGEVRTRDELVGDPDENILPAVGPKVWLNCASFLYITFDQADSYYYDDANKSRRPDYLDNTRVHPEDYELGRKMAADALELDEEDVKVEVDDGGPAAVVRKLVKDDMQEKVNDLLLEKYAEQLEKNFNQRKRATLETIRAELQSPYEELRRNFAFLSTDDIFTMLTGETKDSLVEGMIVAVTVRRIFRDHVDVKLDCGIEGAISDTEFPNGIGGDRGVEPWQAFSANQTMQAKILFLNRKQLTAQLSLREDALRRTFKREIDHEPGEWDVEQEISDKREAQKEKENVSGRAQRVIKHPLFRPFNSAQAEEYLGSQGRGDVVIRPSSKGLDHLAVTWKVWDNVYQHIDVLELDKENEFSVGKTLKIGGKYTYSDLDELIVNHVKAMAKKVDEMIEDERYNKNASKAQTEQWLVTYSEANPKRSMYSFCLNPKYPGYFYLCFKAGGGAGVSSWHVKVIPNAFELQRNHYPDMRALKNGFKLLFAREKNDRRGYGRS